MLGVAAGGAPGTGMGANPGGVGSSSNSTPLPALCAFSACVSTTQNHHQTTSPLPAAAYLLKLLDDASEPARFAAVCLVLGLLLMRLVEL